MGPFSQNKSPQYTLVADKYPWPRSLVSQNDVMEDVRTKVGRFEMDLGNINDHTMPQLTELEQKHEPWRKQDVAYANINSNPDWSEISWQSQWISIRFRCWILLTIWIGPITPPRCQRHCIWIRFSAELKTWAFMLDFWYLEPVPKTVRTYVLNAMTVYLDSISFSHSILSFQYGFF